MKMVRQGLDKKYRCYFIRGSNTPIPGAASTVKRSALLFYLFAVAGVWVCDTRLPQYIIKRPECTYIQTWHGTPLKLALDMDSVYIAGEEEIDSYKRIL